MPKATDINIKPYYDEYVEPVNEMMTMGGGGIASRDMGLGGNKIQALRRALLGSVFKKLRSKVKTS